MPRPNEIKDRAAMTDHVCDVMHDLYRSATVDSLHARPIDAMQMHIEVAVRAGRITRPQAKLLRKWIADCPFSTTQPGGVIAELNAIGRAAFAGRKRGDLRKERV